MRNLKIVCLLTLIVGFAYAASLPPDDSIYQEMNKELEPKQQKNDVAPEAGSEFVYTYGDNSFIVAVDESFIDSFTEVICRNRLNKYERIIERPDGTFAIYEQVGLIGAAPLLEWRDISAVDAQNRCNSKGWYRVELSDE